jgi:hypothetical protein
MKIIELVFLGRNENSAERTQEVSCFKQRHPRSRSFPLPPNLVRLRLPRLLRESATSRAAKRAGVPVVQMMMILTEFGVGSRVEDEDYLQGLAVLRKAW